MNSKNHNAYTKSIDLDENAPGIHFLIQANSISEWIWPLGIKLTLFYDVCNTLVSIATAIYCVLVHGHIKSDRVFHSMNVMYVVLTVNLLLAHIPIAYLLNIIQLSMESNDNFGLFG